MRHVNLVTRVTSWLRAASRRADFEREMQDEMRAQPVQGPETDRGISLNQVTDGYFEATGIRLLAGRVFTPLFDEAPPTG